jgi:phosphatidate cytidylyltransferase
VKARILSALVLMAAVLAVLLWAPAQVVVVAVGLVMLGCAWEWSAFLRAGGAGERVTFVLTVGALLALGWWLSADAGLLRALLWLAVGWWVLALVYVVRGPSAVARPVAWLAGICVLVPAGVALGRLRVEFADGEYWLLYVLLLVWAADTGAFFSGKALGRHRLAPQVSPGKTWEGVAGGLALASVAAAIAAWWFAMPPLPMILIGAIVAAFSVVGDLIESLMKRYAGVKDSGHLIPGHGGLMDRLDSVTAAAPLLLLCALELLPVAA